MLEKVDLGKKIAKEEFKTLIGDLRTRVGQLQRRARDGDIPVIVVFEGWDAAGKGTLINELIRCLDPRGFDVRTIGKPNAEEEKRPYLWRFWTKLPARGRMTIFDHSWYWRVLAERMAQAVAAEKLAATFADISSFERQLADDGGLLIKFFLHISKKVQKQRLQLLEADPATAWRVTAADWEHHSRYQSFLAAYEEMIQRTDTDFAPWTIIEAHDRRFAVTKILTTLAGIIEDRLAVKTLAVGGSSEPTKPAAGFLPDRELNSSVLNQVDLSLSRPAAEYQAKLKEYQHQLREFEYRAYSSRTPVVIVFEGWDAAGKGGAIRRLTQNMDPRGYTVIPVSAPNDEEKAHHYLWRFWRRIPKAGHIAIFDRSWYGRVLVERVENFCSEPAWRRAYREINEMEQQLVGFGTVIIKFWLHIDQDEQRRRFEERMANPDKQWKINGEDWRNREKWRQYEAAVDEMFFRTSTTYAPWCIVEANSKYYARLKVLERVIAALNERLPANGR